MGGFISAYHGQTHERALLDLSMVTPTSQHLVSQRGPNNCSRKVTEARYEGNNPPPMYAPEPKYYEVYCLWIWKFNSTQAELENNSLAYNYYY